MDCFEEIHEFFTIISRTDGVIIGQCLGREAHNSLRSIRDNNKDVVGEIQATENSSTKLQDQC